MTVLIQSFESISRAYTNPLKDVFVCNGCPQTEPALGLIPWNFP